jgi:hypothetical protein
MRSRPAFTVVSALVVAIAALLLVATARAGGPTMTIGVLDDAVKQPTLLQAEANMALLRSAGFNAVRVTETWALGQTAPPVKDILALENVVAAARQLGMRVGIEVFPRGSSQTPLTEAARAQFARFAASLARSLKVRDFVVGNEPNLNRFWMPQFNPDGSDAAAPAFLQLLTQTYDALKAVDPGIVVDGVGVSPRGIDRPGTGRDTHSPTAFIQDLGAAYRASGRTLPIMDTFDIHVYGENSSIAPTFAHPASTTISLADYAKLVPFLGQGFDGTPQPGSTLPIVYGEYGVETTIPPGKAAAYTGTEPATTKPVDPSTQGAYYRQAIALAFCQPNVRALYIFHAFDEPGHAGWQSGVYYADQTPKPSLPIVREAISEAHRGIIARCPGLELTPEALRLVWPHGRLSASTPVRFRLNCSIDCRYTASLEKVPSGAAVISARGRLVGQTANRVSLVRRVAPGRYRLRLTLAAAVNPGPPRVLTSPPFVLLP